MPKIKSAYSNLVKYDLTSLLPLVVVFLVAICSFVRDDPDFYFIVENGNKILSDGFPHTDWMSMHDGLHIVIQQWIPSVIDSIIYNSFGSLGIFFLYVVIFVTFSFAFMNTVKYLTNNNHLVSYLSTIIVSIAITCFFGTPRPQPYSITLTVIAIHLMEKWSREKNDKLLLFMPLISIIQANFHSTFFLAIMGVYATYALFNAVENKKVNYKLLTSLILSFAIGLVNPYGYEGIFHPLYTIGYPIYSCVGELQQPEAIVLLVFVIIPVFVVGVLIGNKKIDKKQMPLLFLSFITLVGSVASNRVLLFGITISSLLISSFFASDIKEKTPLPISEKDRHLKKITFAFALAFSVIFFSINCFDYGLSKDYRFRGLAEVVNYCKESDIKIEGKTFLTPNISEGQYLHHYLGSKSYIDGRLETYIDSLNKKEDISTEFYNMLYGITSQKRFLEKYRFDYILDFKGSNISNTIEDSSEELGYVLAYSSSELRLYRRS